MTHIESSSPETLKDEPKTGIEQLYDIYDDKNISANLVNGAMTLDVTLRHTKNAVATGRDISILGVPSQELLTDLILDMPVGVREPHPLGRELFYGLVNESRVGETTMANDLISFTRAVQSTTSPYGNLENQGRLELAANLDAYAQGLSNVAQRLVDSKLDTRRLGHEGDKIDDLHPEIYREFIDRDYLRFMLANRHERGLPGLTGQVALRLMKEAEWLHRQEMRQLDEM